MKLDDGLQWAGAVFIIGGHGLNAVGPAVYPWNVLAFFIGTIFFLAWALRQGNRPQLLVNLVAIAIGCWGLWSAFDK